MWNGSFPVKERFYMKKFFALFALVSLVALFSCSKKTYTTDDSDLNYESYKTVPDGNSPSGK